jgi:hypothetical protein
MTRQMVGGIAEVPSAGSLRPSGVKGKDRVDSLNSEVVTIRIRGKVLRGLSQIVK